MSTRTQPNFAPALGDYTTGQPPTQFNGRVDIITPGPKLDLPGYQKLTPPNNCTFAQEATAGLTQPNQLSTLFFSPDNIEALQQGLRYRVFVESKGKYVIGRQSDTELKIVMRSIYLQYGRNQPTDIIGQVRELNGYVLDWVVPEVLSNVKQYETYQVDISTLPRPLDNAALMTTKGTKVLEIKKFM